MIRRPLTIALGVGALFLLAFAEPAAAQYNWGSAYAVGHGGPTQTIRDIDELGFGGGLGAGIRLREPRGGGIGLEFTTNWLHHVGGIAKYTHVNTLAFTARGRGDWTTQFRLGGDVGLGQGNKTRMVVLGLGSRIGPFEPTALSAALELWARMGQGPTEQFALLVGADLVLEWCFWDSRDE